MEIYHSTGKVTCLIQIKQQGACSPHNEDYWIPFHGMNG